MIDQPDSRVPLFGRGYLETLEWSIRFAPSARGYLFSVFSFRFRARTHGGSGAARSVLVSPILSPLQGGSGFSDSTQD
jgi:hypothetical protein